MKFFLLFLVFLVPLVGEKEDVIQRFSKIDINEEIEKGKAVQAQLGIRDFLLNFKKQNTF